MNLLWIHINRRESSCEEKHSLREFIWSFFFISSLFRTEFSGSVWWFFPFKSNTVSCLSGDNVQIVYCFSFCNLYQFSALVSSLTLSLFKQLSELFVCAPYVYLSLKMDLILWLLLMHMYKKLLTTETASLKADISGCHAKTSTLTALHLGI